MPAGPATAFPMRRASSRCDAGATTTTCAGSAIAKTPSSAWARMLWPPTETKAFGSGRSRRVPEPAATTMMATFGALLMRRGYRWFRYARCADYSTHRGCPLRGLLNPQGLRGQNLVEDARGLLFVGLLGECQLGDQDLARLGEHPL